MTFEAATAADIRFSTVGGITIGWDICGTCRHHVGICACDEGPTEPEFLARERTAADPPIARTPLLTSAA